MLPVVPSSARFSDAVTGSNVGGALVGCSTLAQNNRFYLGPLLYAGGNSYRTYGSGGFVNTVSSVNSGVMTIAGQQGYLNGLADLAPISTWTVAAQYPIYLGFRSMSSDGIPSGTNFCYTGKAQAFAIYSRTLSASEVWTVSRQMAYCDKHPDWSVWTPQRKWFSSPLIATRRTPQAMRSGSRGTVE